MVGFGLFVASMTAGRLCGTVLLDRYGRVAVLWSTMASAGVGVLLIVFGHTPGGGVIGIVLWGLGASLGLPGRDERRCRRGGARAGAGQRGRRRSRYTAFLAGPPLLGFLGDEVGTLHALLAVAVLLIPSALLVPSARPPHHSSKSADV